MSSTSWKNLIPRRKYRERRQLSGRQHLGILEKKQDYKRRAVEFHKKEKTIEGLREKAINKNPDEFYYNMINSKVVNGEHKIISKKGGDDTHKNLNLVNLNMMVQKNKAERLQAQLHLLDIEKPNTHTYFVQNKGQIKRKVKELEKKKEVEPSIPFEQFGGDVKEFEQFYTKLQRERKRQYNRKC